MQYYGNDTRVIGVYEPNYDDSLAKQTHGQQGNAGMHSYGQYQTPAPGKSQ